MDNGSSYTGTLLERLGTMADFEAIPYGVVDRRSLWDYTHYILSGRRRNDPAMNAANSMIVRFAVEHSKPLLGICYGAELLALTVGGTIRRMPGHIRGNASVSVTRENPLCSGVVDVFESHRYEIARMPPPLETVGSSDACRHEIVRYGHSMIYGTQFHPEMTPDGLEMVRRFALLRGG